MTLLCYFFYAIVSVAAYSSNLMICGALVLQFKMNLNFEAMYGLGGGAEGEGAVLSNINFTGMCHCEGYGFQLKQFNLG